MSCSVDIWNDADKRGRTMNVTGTIRDLNGQTIGRQDVDSFQVNGCENTVVTACRYIQDTDNGVDCMYLRGYNPNLGWRRKFNDNNWNNEWDSIRFTPVPGEDADNLEHNRISHRYTPNSPNDGYCSGCRLWPQVKDRNNPSNANRDDVWMKEDPPVGYAGVRPCPGGEGYFTSGSGIKCRYKKNDRGATLQTLHSSKGTDSELGAMWVNLSNKFCAISENLLGDPGGGTCLEKNKGSEIAKQFCLVGDRIKSNGSCVPGNLGNHYAAVAQSYCQTATGKADQWCSCYNVTNGVCTSTPAAAGCDTKRQQFDKLVESTPVAYKPLWAGREACFGSVCQGSKYIPENANQNCNSPIQICSQTFDLSQISESSIEAKCNLTADTGTQPSVSDGSSPPSGGGGGSGGSGGGGSDGGSPQTGINAYIPTSIDDLKTDSKKQMAVGGVGILFMCCCCMFLLLLVAG